MVYGRSNTMTALVVTSSSADPFRVRAIVREGDAMLDPTSFPVLFAFPSEGAADPADEDYVAGTWEIDGDKFFGRGTIKDLTEGRYDLWMWVNAGPSASPRSKVGLVIVS
jgi:hypothetical protein